jgi:hypothetical protein
LNCSAELVLGFNWTQAVEMGKKIPVLLLGYPEKDPKQVS